MEYGLDLNIVFQPINLIINVLSTAISKVGYFLHLYTFTSTASHTEIGYNNFYNNGKTKYM